MCVCVCVYTEVLLVRNMMGFDPQVPQKWTKSQGGLYTILPEGIKKECSQMVYQHRKMTYLNEALDSNNLKPSRMATPLLKCLVLVTATASVVLQGT